MSKLKMGISEIRIQGSTAKVKIHLFPEIEEKEMAALKPKLENLMFHPGEVAQAEILLRPNEKMTPLLRQISEAVRDYVNCYIGADIEDVELIDGSEEGGGS